MLVQLKDGSVTLITTFCFFNIIIGWIYNTKFQEQQINLLRCFTQSMQKRVDKSLKLLKQLQQKLKINQLLNPQTPTKAKITPIYQQQTADPDRNFKQHYIKMQSPKQSSLVNSKIAITPKIANEHCSKCQQLQHKMYSVQQQNKRMKNYINCLIKMNEFLKTQVLEQNESLIKVKRQKQQCFQRENPEATIMKMEIEYLKKLNDDREKQIYQYHMDINRQYLHSQLSDQSIATPANNYFHLRNQSIATKKKHNKHYTSLNVCQQRDEPINNRKVKKAQNISILTKKRKQSKIHSKDPQLNEKHDKMNHVKACCKHNFY